jgi:hypothetical protein
VIYRLDLTKRAQDDIAFHKKSGNKAILNKIAALFDELTEHPFTGPGSAEFESAGGMQGNQQQGGTCLKIIPIPELEYYPRIYNIRVNFTTSEGPMTFNHRLVMIDCTGTKPDCEGYHSQKVYDENSQHEQEENPDQNEIEDQDFKTMEVYDLLGRLLYQGQILSLNHIDLPLNQVLIIRYLGKDGQNKKTRKTIKVR